MEKALSLFEQIEAQENSAEVQVGKGRALRDLERLDEAASAFQAAIGLDSVHLQAHLGLAGVLAAQQRTAEAFELLAKATTQGKRIKEEGGTQAAIFLVLGEMELKLKVLSEALGLFKQAGQAAPEDSSLQVAMGDALAQSGHLGESEAFYLKALELDPELAHVFNRLGMNMRRQGRRQEALEMYRKARTFHPEDEHLMYNMALCLWEMHAWEEAEALLRKALATVPDLEAALQLLELVRHRKGPGGHGSGVEAGVDLDRAGR